MAAPSFNEAPIHESGKSTIFAYNEIAFRRFNEAPIHESGKYERQADRAHGEARFNEAPIHESGKCLVQIVLVSDEIDASMRPRFMNRGSGARAGKAVPG